ncbi:MAG: sensor domain-containing diguanylate cyclase [Candidatus Saelkia tenebricola]|nr:sensor domain-containing diguanylate cyclase [Candidatus Saelkia tenebricola]
MYFLLMIVIQGVRYYRYKTKHTVQLDSLNLELESIKEAANINNVQYLELLKINEALEKKISRFTDLRKFSEDIIANLDLNELLNVITQKVMEIIARGDVCLIYLFDHKNESFNLANSYLASSKLKVRAKKGDPCEHWVFRQRTPLILTDILRDFRFDSEEVFSYGREFRSLISVPIISRNKFLGVIRMDSIMTEEFTADDLRLLDIIAALSAIAIDNAFLFQMMEELAVHDSLTKFYLRREFLNLFDKRIAQAQNKTDYFAVLMIDIDDFKNCNDNFGHITGDLVLKSIARIIRSVLMKEEYACRYGGEEFLILLNVRDKNEFEQRIELIRQTIESSQIRIRRQVVNVTVTIGVAFFPQDGKSTSDLIEASDNRLYKGKRTGKNKIIYE